MLEQAQEEKTYDVEDVFNPTLAKIIYKEIMNSRKFVSEEVFSYDTIEKSNGEKTFVIKPRHIPISEVLSFGKSSCNKCYGTGRTIRDVDKSEIPDVKDFTMLSSISFDGLSDEQKKIVLEREKAAKFWRLLLPCPCVLKNMRKKGMYILSNNMMNIIIELTCTEKIGE